MATNNFKAFALDPNANVMSQADWEALPALLSGFTAGKASSAQVNKAIRQATTIAALVGQFIANSGADALDNADVNGLVTKFTNALIANLGLGTAAQRNVGTGANQIPDMNSFPVSKSKSGWTKLPNGMIFQWGVFSGNLTSQISGNYPIAFTSAVYVTAGVMSDSAQFNRSASTSAINMENTSLTTWGANLTDVAINNNYRYAYWAIGA